MKKVTNEILLLILSFIILAFYSFKQFIFSFFILLIYIILKYLNKKIKKNKVCLSLKIKNENIYKILPFILIFIYIIINFNSLNIVKEWVMVVLNFILFYLLCDVCNICYYAKQDNKDFENKALIKTIILDKVPTNFLKYIKILRRAKINIILLDKENLANNIKKYFINTSFDDIDKYKYKNIQINDYKKNKKLSNILNSEEICYCESENLKDEIEKIKKGRSIYDNLKRSIKINIVAIFVLFLFYIIMPVIGFPKPLSIYALLIIFLVFYFINNFILPYLPFDQGIMDRYPFIKNNLFNKQDILIILVVALSIFFAVSGTFMFLMASGSSLKLASTVCLITYFYSLLFIIFYSISDKIIVLNILNNLKNKVVLILVLLFIILTFLLQVIPCLNTKMVGLNNYISSIIIALIFTCYLDIIKLARYTSIRKKG